MDLLKKEIERKKKAVALAREQTSSKNSRFVKAVDLRRIQDEEEERLRQKRPRVEGVTNNNTRTHDPLSEIVPGKEDSNQLIPTSTTETVGQTPTAATSDEASPSPGSKRPRSTSLAKIAPHELVMQLRALSLPIRLFGESLEGRILRLQRALEQQTVQSKTQTEMDEFRLGKGHGIRNPFLDRKGDNDQDEKKKKTGLVGESASSVAVATKQEPEENDVSNDPHKKVYRYLKGLLNQWEDELALRPESSKRTAAGKNETKTLKQCKDYIRPLFKQLKTRKLEEGLLHHMIKIVDYCKEGEFVRAHDAYLDLAIGRSAWPIGVTMVGIHARSGRAKIEAANVAHVMNSELHRKYLTSVKRLMTYAQKKADNVDPSKKVLN
jgi:pre-mRNA-splicing factor 18